jgi:hypothetical protein
MRRPARSGVVPVAQGESRGFFLGFVVQTLMSVLFGLILS